VLLLGSDYESDVRLLAFHDAKSAVYVNLCTAADKSELTERRASLGSLSK
jgi:hypothetical protein